MSNTHRLLRLLAPIALLAIVFSAGCGGKRVMITHEIPEPGVSFPYGLVAFEVEAGDTRRAAIMLEQAGYFTRRVDIGRDGVVVARMRPGTWEVYITGIPGRGGDVIRFGGAAEPTPPPAEETDPSRPKKWPEAPITIQVERNKLTLAGKFCAHRGCTTPWIAMNPEPIHDEWMTQGRLLITDAPLPPPVQPESPEGSSEPSDGSGEGAATPESTPAATPESESVPDATPESPGTPADRPDPAELGDEP